MRPNRSVMILLGASVCGLRAEEIVVRVIESKNAKPARGVQMVVQMMRFGHTPTSKQLQTTETDRYGTATFHFDPPLLSHIGISLQSALTCSQDIYSIADVLESGVVAENHCKEKVSRDEEIRAKRGEIVIFMAKDSLLKRMRRAP